MKVKFVDGIISVAEAAALRGVSQSSVRSAIRSGRLAAVKMAGHVGIRAADVMACAFRSKAENPVQ